MISAALETYVRGETAIFTAYFTDKDNEAADPSVSRKIRIADPTGALVVLSGTLTEVDMVTDGGDTGRWKYAYTFGASALKGEWTAEEIGTDGAGNDVSMGRGKVMVKPRVGDDDFDPKAD